MDEKKNNFYTSKFYCKKELYETINTIKQHLCINSIPINPYIIIQKLNTELDYCEEYFETKGICGLLFRNKKKSHIVVNSSLLELEKNFAISHELIHYFCHDQKQSFMCRPYTERTNNYIEWQANEGAAELLVPYKIFIPLYLEKAVIFPPKTAVMMMANYFGVSTTVIDYRIESLKYELFQYSNGVSINEIIILSKTKREQLKIRIDDPIKKYSEYLRKNKGGGTIMRYSGVDVDENNKLMICPICHNDDITVGTYCKICGTSLVNKCAHVYYDDRGNEHSNGCLQDEILGPEVRFCPHCGSQTTFYLANIIPSYCDTQEYKVEFDNKKVKDNDEGELPF